MSCTAELLEMTDDLDEKKYFLHPTPAVKPSRLSDCKAVAAQMVGGSDEVKQLVDAANAVKLRNKNTFAGSALVKSLLDMSMVSNSEWSAAINGSEDVFPSPDVSWLLESSNVAR